MINHLASSIRRASIVGLSLLAWRVGEPSAEANPAGGTVAQGTATITSQGPQLTVQVSDQAHLNWQSFNIGVGETTTFVQPSSSSVVWNHINDQNPSQILGSLNANGYVVLQNQAGFYIGGTGIINTHGLLLTTAPIAPPDVSSGGAWQFNAPPPMASIVNYGQIHVEGGNPAFLIACNIENHGTIEAPGGKIGLYAGKDVLVSTSPDGRGLSAQVTLPEGSVDNDGKLIADAGTIAMRARVVNQGGLVQANSVREVNGTIELVASDAVNLGANSVISAQGDSDGVSPGGSVIIKSDNSFSDQAGSMVDASGGAVGGNGGDVEISAKKMSRIQSQLASHAAVGYLGGRLYLDPDNVFLQSGGESASSGTIHAGDPGDTGDSGNDLILDPSSFSSFSQILIEALNNIELSTMWTLANSTIPASLTLSAGNNIILDNGASISAGNNWSVNLTAGTALTPGDMPADGNAGIYLNGTSFIETRDGNITLQAPNEVIVHTGAVRTRNGGSISVTTEFGDVNAGDNQNGYIFNQTTRTKPNPYSVNVANLGGISTAAGGNVTINAGRDVISHLFSPADVNGGFVTDAGTGAFGAQPGNVNIHAGRDVIGHYVLANGVGDITAGANVGELNAGTANFALSLIKGTWNVFAPHGNIRLQEVRNPNGVYNNAGSISTTGFHLFDYDSRAATHLEAENDIEITGGAPRIGGAPVPILFPSSLEVVTHSGDFILDADVILFPSPNGELNTDIGGNFISHNPSGNYLAMSDSGSQQWNPTPVNNFGSFLDTDHAATPPELNNANPVEINVAGNLENVTLKTDKKTEITVGGDMVNSSFTGENLHGDDVTSVDVAGRIFNSPLYTFVHLASGIESANPLLPDAWDSVFTLALDPAQLASLANVDVKTITGSLADFLQTHNYLLFPGAGGAGGLGVNPGFVYDASGHQLGFKGRISSLVISSQQLAVLEPDSHGNPATFTVLVVNSQGAPQIDSNGHFLTRTYTFGASSQIAALSQVSQNAVASTTGQATGFQIGGPGEFDIHAASMELGNSRGIVSWGSYDGNGVTYGSLANLTPSGAAVKVDVDGNISMITSTIASIDGGDVNVNVGGEIDLSQTGFNFFPKDTGVICYGIFTSGLSDVHVTAGGDVNVGSARIATFNGGDITVESLDGDVNAGNGANVTLYVPVMYRVAGQLKSGKIESPLPFGSGILAVLPTPTYQSSGANGSPGDIRVETPHGDIVSTLGGISQYTLNGTAPVGPTITLIAGTPDPDGPAGPLSAIPGSVRLGSAGLIGGSVNITAQGNVEGFIVSRQDSKINASQNFVGTVLSGGSSDVAAGGVVSGTIIGVGGVNISGSSTAVLLGQNVAINGGSSESTLGSSATATSASQSAAQQSNTEAKQELASNDESQDDDLKKKKRPGLTRRVGRVTVILPPA